MQVIKPGELKQSEISAWRDLQAGDSNLGNPFFAPEFTQAVGLARSDAFVSVFESDGRTVGFLPFQRRGRTAKPIGAAICDYQGLIGAKSCALSAREFLEGCGLDVFDFNHVPASQSMFWQHSTTISHSPYIDLASG